MEKVEKTVIEKIRLNNEERQLLEEARNILENIIDTMGCDGLDLVGHTIIKYNSLTKSIETLNDLSEENEYFSFEE